MERIPKLSGFLHQEFFIDRKPNFFPLILDYLRNGKLDGNLGIDTIDLTPWEQRCLYGDIRYLRLNSLMHLTKTVKLVRTLKGHKYDESLQWTPATR